MMREKILLRFFLAGVMMMVMVAGTSAFAQSTRHRPDVSGTEFFIVFPKAAWGSQTVGVLINSPVRQTISIGVPRDTVRHLTVNAGDTTIYYTGPFNVEYIPEVRRSNKVVRIRSEYPITVHGQFGANAISGTYTAYPTSSWGQEYYVVDVPEGPNQDYQLYPTVYSVPTVTIIASHDETGITIWPKTATAKNGHAPPDPFTIALDSGDVYTLSTAGDPNAYPRNELACDGEISGTHITANKPIGVLVAQSHTAWPCGDNECGDYGVEWLPPMAMWDTTYVIPPTVPRVGDITGIVQLRAVFSVDSTRLYMTDAQGHDVAEGMYMAGDYTDLKTAPPYILHGNHPFLCVEITPHPVDCITGNAGSDKWTFSMNIPTGVRQWCDNVWFSSAVGSDENRANIFFRERDKANLYYNGKPFTTVFPRSYTVGSTFSYVVDSFLVPGQFYQITGKNGAVAGGMVYGHGTSSYRPSGGQKGARTIQGPLVIKSFGHPAAINSIILSTTDTMPPTDSVGFSCGHWTVTTHDDLNDILPTGINAITILREGGLDSSYNVVFNPAPNFAYGDLAVTFGIDVVNLSQPAMARLRIRDGAGNQFDTSLVYRPLVVDAVPATSNVGALRAGDSTSACAVLKNRGVDPVTFSRSRLRFGTSWRIIPPSPLGSFTIAPGDSVHFCFEYTAPNSIGLECDPDTLLVTTCKEFPIAAMIGCNKRPAMFAQSVDFGEMRIDTVGQQGEQRTANIFVASTGSDSLHVTSIHVGGITMIDPDSDFNVVVVAPTPDRPWVLAPGDTQWIVVAAHPHHSGLRKAFVSFANDATTNDDSSFIAATGIVLTDVQENMQAPVEADLMQGYPNPSSSAATLTFSAPGYGSYAVELYDNLGGRVATVNAEPASTGMFAAHWSAAHMRTGVYHYVVIDKSTGRRISPTEGKIIVIK